jgi:hypothetical protein
MATWTWQLDINFVYAGRHAARVAPWFPDEAMGLNKNRRAIFDKDERAIFGRTD